MPEFLLNTLIIVAVVLVFNFIIFFHELGHFLAARWRGLKIDRFQIWFGKPIWKKEINGVQYGLGWIPAGGFVALPQMAPMEAIEGGNRDEDAAPLPPIKPLDKIIVAFAGPLFSFLLAVMAACVIWKVGKPNGKIPTTTIGWVEPSGKGAEAGLQRGDRITAINGQQVTSWDGKLDSVFLNVITSRGQKIAFTVDRPGVGPMVLESSFSIQPTKWWQRRAVRDVGIVPMESGPVKITSVAKDSPSEAAGLKENDVIKTFNGQPMYNREQAIDFLHANGEKPVEVAFKRGEEEKKVTLTPVIPFKTPEDPPRPMIGAGLSSEVAIDDGLVNPKPWEQISETVRTMWVTIVSVASPDSSVGVQHLSGPVGMGKFQFHLWLADHPLHRILGYLVLVNINLAILNMLPFPVLDGGHITLACMEWIARRPVRARWLEAIQLAFVALLISLMLYVTSKDIPDNMGMGGGKGGEVIFKDPAKSAPAAPATP